MQERVGREIVLFRRFYVALIEDATRERGYRIVGDVDFEAVKEVAGAISPVPGGVGPMTITMLLSNTVDAAVNIADGA